MNRNQHITIGLFGFVLYAVAILRVWSFDYDALAYGGIASIVGSMFPDIIEPADSWKHRGFGHSRRVFWRLGVVFLVCTLLALVYQYVLIMAGLLLGYELHLLADSTTKVGLPE